MFVDHHTFPCEHCVTSDRHSQMTWLRQSLLPLSTHVSTMETLIHGSTNIKKLQHVQISVAHTVSPNLSQQPGTALLSELHWLVATC